MSHQPDLIAEDIYQYLKQDEEKKLLRFIICDSVDDGKPTLISRLLHDTKMICEDQLTAISRDSETHGAAGAELAILLIDARYGVQTQTKRHIFICSLLGIKHFVIAVDKMDLVDFSQEKFEKIKASYYEFSGPLDIPNTEFIPISTLGGDNIASFSERIPWYKGQPLLTLLENAEIEESSTLSKGRFPVQYVNGPHLNFRGFCGTVVSGVFSTGQPIKVLPSKKVSTIKSIICFDGELHEAHAGDAITITLNDEINISRGDMLVAEEDDIEPSNVLLVDVVWMHETPLQVGKNYFIKVGTAEVIGSVSEIQYQVDVNTLDQIKVSELGLNGIARCKLEVNRPVLVDPYKKSRHTGKLIFIDCLSNTTVGAGMVAELLNDENILWHQMDVTKQLRADRYNQKPCVVWFTGLSGSGKSTSANTLEKTLFAMGYNTYLLDGDNVRHGLCSDLGFSDRDRSENIRRVGEVAKLMVDAGHVVLTSFISPFRRERSMVRQMVEPGEFIEVYVKTPLSICEQRDSKGLYKKAREGLIRDFTGISSPYEEPENPEITVDTDDMSIEEVANFLLRKLRSYGVIS